MSAPDVEGIRFYTSAEAQEGYADDAQMNEWTDLSGNDFHAVGVAGTGGAKPLYTTDQGPNSGPGVLFQSGNANKVGGYFDLPAGVFTGLTQATLFLIIRSLQAQTTHIEIGPADSPHFPFNTEIYENFCAGARYQYTNSLPVVNNWRTYMVKAPAGTGAHQCYIDGVAQPPSPPRTFTIPVTRKLGGGSSYNFAGLMTAAFVIDHATTAPEDAILEAWADANMNGGTLGPPPQEPTQSDSDYAMSWLISEGHTSGTRRDREMAFLRSQASAPSNKNLISFNDLQKFYGKPIRDDLVPSDWA